MSKEVEYITTGLRIPWSMISEELNGLYGSTLLSEFKEIIRYYEVYENGAKFVSESAKTDFTGADLRFKECRKLINKEARFLFSKHPDFWVRVPYDKDSKNEGVKLTAKAQTTILQNYVDSVFRSTGLYAKLVKAAKDCFIGKRVAYFVNFDEVNQRIMIDFIPSLEFVFETDPNDTSRLTKIVTFYTIKDSKNKVEQQVYKKKYWLEGEDETCWLSEAIYDGTGTVIEEITPDRATQFKGRIPAGVIINDGLTGDMDRHFSLCLHPM